MKKCFSPKAKSDRFAHDRLQQRREGRTRGVALVLVLAFLVIVTALIIAFFSSVTTELTSAKGYEGEAVAKQIGDSAVQSVMGTIAQATTTPSGSTWASQPGMIWNYNVSGTATSAYKLYSSDTAVVTSPATSYDSSADVSTTWSKQPAMFTDLNSPVSRPVAPTTAVPSPTPAEVFPIVDGNAMVSMTVDGGTQPVLTYSTNGTTQDVVGFSVNPNAYPGDVTFSPGSTPSPTNNPVPMPTKWVYLLKNGTMTAPTGIDVTGNIVNWSASTNPPTTTNPIVGRVAYWTDDETCKVNINTASEGSSWDTPRGHSRTEELYADYQPAQHEWQRYPGHPATTSLSTVFPAFTASQIYNIAPRVVDGGSMGGTQKAAGSLTADGDRLYASLDELIFNPARGVNPTNTAGTTTGAGNLTRAQVEQKKFFLTARSVAPELNVYELPRIACWPLYTLPYDSIHTTAFDRLIGTCSTVNNYPFFFQRQNAMSTTADMGILRNQQLYTYLQNLTSTAEPGFGAAFRDKYTVAGRDQILTEIFDYIRSTNLADDVVASQSGGVPYTPLTTSDTVTTTGHGFVAPIQYTPKNTGTITQGFGRAYTLSEFGIGLICNADGNDTTLGSNNPKTNPVFGSATAPALAANQKYVQAMIVMELFSPMEGWTAICPDMQVQITGLGGLSITDSTGTHSLGIPDGTTSFTLTPASQYSGMAWGGNPGWRYTLLGKYMPGPRGGYPGDNPSGTPYPFIGIPVLVQVPVGTSTAPLLGFSGDANIVVKIYAGASATQSPTNLMQTININMPPTSIPYPNLVNAGTGGSANSTVPQNWWSFGRAGYAAFTPVTLPGQQPQMGGGRLTFSNQSSWTTPTSSTYVIASGAFFYNQATIYPTPAWNKTGFDVVRTVLPGHGDYRLVAGLNTVPVSVFTPQDHYMDPTYFMASNLSNSNAEFAEQGNSATGKFFAVNGYNFFPDISANTGTVTPETNNTWDVDSGLPNCQDGGFINKPDEGSVTTDGTLPYFTNYQNQYAGGPTYFTPNRIMISSGMFGSLPTGIVPPQTPGGLPSLTPWQTLLFRAQPSHPMSSKSPPDHLFMDLFWMPVVEPYAISDRFSTSGKINMNYQIAPFKYITRNTGLRALMKNEKMAAIINGFSSTGYGLFKSSTKDSAPMATTANQQEIRMSVDAVQTLTQFDKYFQTSGLFRSASQICDLYIVPTDPQSGQQTPASMPAYWVNHIGTGDNLRERIYTTLYPRLTTRSNTYTVHYRAQALVQSPASLAATPVVWNETKDTVNGDIRGSSVIERYIDPGDTTIPDFATAALPVTSSLDSYYHWRIVESHRFAP